MRGPISEAIIVVALGFFIGGIAGAIIHFTFDSSNAIVPHPASGTRYAEHPIIRSNDAPPLPAAVVLRRTSVVSRAKIVACRWQSC
jgi:hypothetical protein